MPTTAKYLLGSQTTLLTTGISSLGGSGSLAATASAFDNTQAATGDGYVLCELELVLASVASARSANTGWSVWFCQSQDGTNYEDGWDASVVPARTPNVVIPVRAVTGAQRIIVRALVPEGKFYTLVQNNDGQTSASSGNSLKIRPVTFQGV